jgi:hypothetical protein
MVCRISCPPPCLRFRFQVEGDRWMRCRRQEEHGTDTTERGMPSRGVYSRKGYTIGRGIVVTFVCRKVGPAIAEQQGEGRLVGNRDGGSRRNPKLKRKQSRKGILSSRGFVPRSPANGSASILLTSVLPHKLKHLFHPPQYHCPLKDAIASSGDLRGDLRLSLSNL